MPDKTATTLNKAAGRAFKPIPAPRRNTLPLDNGKEFAAHKSLSQVLGVDLSFAHPYHSWERGLNEHTTDLAVRFGASSRRWWRLMKRYSCTTPGGLICPLTMKRLKKCTGGLHNNLSTYFRT
jgi:hypothetical protein